MLTTPWSILWLCVAAVVYSFMHITFTKPREPHISIDFVKYPPSPDGFYWFIDVPEVNQYEVRLVSDNQAVSYYHPIPWISQLRVDHACHLILIMYREDKK